MSLINYFRTDGWVKTIQGPAVPGAQVYVCLQPANVAGTPPSPLANIFSDPSGLVPITQPILPDGFGHYDFYAAAGVYTLVVAFGCVIQQVYLDQSVGAAGSHGVVTSLSLLINGVAASSQTVQNLIPGASMTITDGGNGQITIGTTVSGVQTVKFMIGPGIVDFTEPDSVINNVSPCGIGSSLNILAFRFNFPFNLTFSTMRYSGIGASSHFTVGIYSGPSSQTPGTLLWTSGPIALTGSQVAGTVSSAPYTLVPGDYYLATTSDSASATVYGVPLGSDSGFTTKGLCQTTPVLFGLASNQATGTGVLPASLGTVAANASTNSYGWPLVMFS